MLLNVSDQIRSFGSQRPPHHSLNIGCCGINPFGLHLPFRLNIYVRVRALGPPLPVRLHNLYYNLYSVCIRRRKASGAEAHRKACSGTMRREFRDLSEGGNRAAIRS